MIEVAKEALWLTRMVKELGVQKCKIYLKCDSQSFIYLAKNQVYHVRIKHIDVKFHRIGELNSSGELLLEKVHTSENVVTYWQNILSRTSSSNISRC